MDLPISPYLSHIAECLAANSVTILQAAPGAGKSTEVPLYLLKNTAQKMLLLEPRRVAARALAQFLSLKLGEVPGGTVGYRMRGESRTSKQTRLQIITEGLMARMLIDDPSLNGVTYLLFDEFHERSLHADTALAISAEIQKHLREDLRILILSATLDIDRLGKLFPQAPVIEVPGRVFPVETIYRGKSDRLETGIISAATEALRNTEGDILAFLPGRAEIERTRKQAKLSCPIISLTADTRAEESSALFETSAQSRLILSTSVAETSITLPGVRTVIDSGLSRYMIFNSETGLNELVTKKSSAAVVEQRRGRAGRVQAGKCYRLWSENDFLNDHLEPEILRADLSSLALELAAFGVSNPEELLFLNYPATERWSKAQELLQALHVLDASFKITEDGKSLLKFGVHPRLGHLLCEGSKLGAAKTSAFVAALLESTERTRDTVTESLQQLSQNTKLHAERLWNLLGNQSDERPPHFGALLALAYPERLGRKTDRGTYRISVGGEGKVAEGSVLSRSEFLAIGRLDMRGSSGRITLAEPISFDEVERFYPVNSVRELAVKNGKITCVEKLKVGQLIVREKEGVPTAEERRKINLEFIGDGGLNNLMDEGIFQRSEWGRSRGAFAKEWPVITENSILEGAEEIFGAVLESASPRDRELFSDSLKALFSYSQLQELDRKVPEFLEFSTGSRSAFIYTSDKVRLSILLQELFGREEGPQILGVPVQLELLSPAKRPIQLTTDLKSFWANTYPQLRKQLLRDYPRHIWPEDPIKASPVKAGLKRNAK